MSSSIGQFVIGQSPIGEGLPVKPKNNIPVITAQQFALQIAQLYPRGWAGDGAKISGVFSQLLNAFGTELVYSLSQIQYCANAMRIQTETSPELDEASVDFFGPGVFPRAPGQSDASYLMVIEANLLQTAQTRTALSNAIQALTGAAPRMLEPWNPGDTGAWSETGANSPGYLGDPLGGEVGDPSGGFVGDPTGGGGTAISFWNVDTRAHPARWASYMGYEGFILMLPPAITPTGNNPVFCWGDSAYWNVPGYFFGIIQVTLASQIYSLINRLMAFGTVIWVQFVKQAQLT